MKICGHNVKVGDYVKVQYTTGQTFKGRIIKGIITKLWDENSKDIEVKNPKGFKQGQVEHGWCFHEEDHILEHTASAL